MLLRAPLASASQFVPLWTYCLQHRQHRAHGRAALPQHALPPPDQCRTLTPHDHVFYRSSERLPWRAWEGPCSRASSAPFPSATANPGSAVPTFPRRFNFSFSIRPTSRHSLIVLSPRVTTMFQPRTTTNGSVRRMPFCPSPNTRCLRFALSCSLEMAIVCHPPNECNYLEHLRRKLKSTPLEVQHEHIYLMCQVRQWPSQT